MKTFDTPQPEKVYSLYNLSRTGRWSDSQVKIPEPTPEEIKAQREARELAQREQAEAKIRFDAEVRAMPANHPHLETTKSGKAGYVLAARNIRTELKRAFPNVKFSVRSESFSMGNSIDVRWTDGPTTDQVSAITSKYESGTFDGMTDCYNYEHSPFKNVFGESKYIHESRTFSEKLFNKIVLALVDEYGIKGLPAWDEYHNGIAYGTPLGNADGEQYWTWQSLINRKAGEIAL